MALSEKWALEKARELLWNPRYTGFNPVAFTRAIEAEVRKQDEALIRQCMEALECAGAYTALIDDISLSAIQEAYKAASARLEENQ